LTPVSTSVVLSSNVSSTA